MFGKTNATVGGGGSSGGTITLLWTNPNPSANFSSITIPSENLIGAVVDVTRTSTAGTPAFLRNFCQAGEAVVVAGRDSNNNVFATRTVTCTSTSISVSAPTDGIQNRTVPLRIYGIQ